MSDRLILEWNKRYTDLPKFKDREAHWAKIEKARELGDLSYLALQQFVEKSLPAPKKRK